MTVWAGVTKLSDAATGVVIETSASYSVNAGALRLFAPGSDGAATYGVGFSGASDFSIGSVSTYAAPVSSVLSSAINLGASGLTNALQIRVDGAGKTLSADDAYTTPGGNFGNYPLYIGRRGGTTLPLNGRIYGLIVRGSVSNAAQIAAAERYVAARTGVAI